MHNLFIANVSENVQIYCIYDIFINDLSPNKYGSTDVMTYK